MRSLPELGLHPSRSWPVVNLRAVMVNDAAWFRAYAEICAGEKLTGVRTGAVRVFSGFPDPADYAALAVEYAERGARPD